MHRNEDSAKPAETQTPKAEWLSQKTKKYVPKISQNIAFWIRHYAMPPPGGGLENIHGCTLHNYIHSGIPDSDSKSWFKSVIFILVLVRTDIAYFQHHLHCTGLTLSSSKEPSEKVFINAYVQSHQRIRWWNFIYR